MNEILEEIKTLYAQFETNATGHVEKPGNASAGRRARKAALELSKLLSKFRKASLEASKPKDKEEDK